MSARTQAERRAVRAGGGEIEYWLTRKRVKNINLRIGRDGRVSASAPPRVSAEAVDGFVRRKASFILRHTERVRAEDEAAPLPSPDCVAYLGRRLRVAARAGQGEPAVEDDTLWLRLPDPSDAAARQAAAQAWLDARSREILTAVAGQVAGGFARWGAAPTKIRVRSMVSRWGSCSTRTGAITLNARLVSVPPAAARYVVIHEFAHLIHPNHSPAFWALVEELAPDWREQRAALARWQRELGM